MSLQIKNNRAVTVGPNLRYKPPQETAHATLGPAALVSLCRTVILRFAMPAVKARVPSKSLLAPLEKRNKNCETLIEQFDRKLKTASA